jgi:ParB family chromosome partitioning protein
MPRNALGRGLSALIREPEPLSSATGPRPPAVPPVSHSAAAAAVPAREADSPGAVLQLDIDLIQPSPYQPRTRFEQAALEELAQSIRSTGIIQPLVVRRSGQRYQLLAGERRWRAAQLAGLHRVPTLVQDVTDEKALEITLIENLQREDLNPIEQAHAFERLIDEFHLTQEEAAARTGKDRVTVANAVRLLKLEQPIRELVETGRLSASHARALLAIEDTRLRLDVARRAAKGNLTVRQIERLASRTKRSRPPNSPGSIDPNTRAAIEELQRVLGTRITITPSSKQRPGQLIVEFYNDADLDRIYQIIVGK